MREVVLATNPTTTGEATALHIAEELRERAPERHGHAPGQRPAGRLRPRVRRRGHARQGPRRPPRAVAQGRGGAAGLLRATGLRSSIGAHSRGDNARQKEIRLFVALKCRGMAGIPDVSELPRSLTIEQFWSLVGDSETGIVDFKEQFREPRSSKSLWWHLRTLAEALSSSECQRPVLIASSPWAGGKTARSASRRWPAQRSLPCTCGSLRSRSKMRLSCSCRSTPSAMAAGTHQRWTSAGASRPTNRALVGSELARFVQERGSIPAEDRPIEGQSIADLDADLLGRYLRSRLGAVV